MSATLTGFVIFFAFIIGGVMGAMTAFLSRGLFANRQIRAAQKRAVRIVAEARAQSKEVVNEARVEIDKIRQSSEAEARERRLELQRQENRLTQKEVHLDHKLEEAEGREHQMLTKEKELDGIKVDLTALKDKELQELEAISRMTSEEAKQELLSAMDAELKLEATRRMREWEVKIKDEAEERARDILAQVIQRNASEVVAETTSSAVPLPSDEMKGRLIGREGAISAPWSRRPEWTSLSTIRRRPLLSPASTPFDARLPARHSINSFWTDAFTRRASRK